jgi:hypothetical protein
MAVRFDRFNLVSRRAERTPEGYLRCDATAARVGVLEYPQPDGRVVREYRPPEEASDPKSLATFGGKAVTLEHPPEMLNAENTREYAVGFTGTEVVYDQGFVRVVVTLTDQEAIDAVLRGDAVEVSAGYEVDLDPTPGVAPDGQPYDAVQRNIRCNHLAVTRRGRAGPEVRLHLDRKEAMAQLTLDNAVFEVPEGVAAAVATHLRARRRDQEEEKEKKLGEILEGMGTRLERLEACSEKWKQDQEGIQQQIAQVLSVLEQLLQKLEAMLPAETPEEPASSDSKEGSPEEPSTATLDSLVEERFRVVAAARQILGDSYDWRGKSTEEIRLDALRSAGIQSEGHTPDYLRARFDALVEAAGSNALRSALDSLPATTGSLLQLRPPSSPARFAYQK